MVFFHKKSVLLIIQGRFDNLTQKDLGQLTFFFCLPLDNDRTDKLDTERSELVANIKHEAHEEEVANQVGRCREHRPGNDFCWRHSGNGCSHLSREAR